MTLSTLEAKKQLLSIPGDTILETIENLGISQTELGERLGKNKGKMSKLINGKTSITNETARKLEMVLGIEASFWLNLEQAYQQEILELEKLEFLEECKSWIKRFPLSFLKRHKYLPDTRDKIKLSEALLKFYSVASPKQWKDIYCEESISFKIELKNTSTPESISTWLRLGELSVQKNNLKDFDKRSINKRIGEFLNICYDPSDEWQNDLKQLCAELGIALCLIPTVPKAPIYGAARWLNNKSTPVIQLTDRNKDYNSFWFSFFHELAHILKHKKNEVFLEGLEDIEQNQDKEREADEFASKYLGIPFGELLDISNFKTFDSLKQKRKIGELSDKLNLNQSIIVSQLQREKLIPYNDFEMNQLKLKVEFNN
jgi:addiction module HigA family antidote